MVGAESVAAQNYGRAVNMKKEYWTCIMDAQGKEQAEHFVDANVGSGTQASALEILRAIAQQKASMKRATYGSRYVDILKSMGININYQMLQRPEIVGISRGAINVTDVVDTGGGTLGTLAGHGISGNRFSMRRKTFPEHGTLTFCAILRPKQMQESICDWFDTPRDYTSFYDPQLVPLPPVGS